MQHRVVWKTLDQYTAMGLEKSSERNELLGKPIIVSVAMKVSIETVVNCSREHLWKFMEDPENLALWVKGLVDFELTSPPPHGAGSVYVMRMKECGRIKEYRGRNIVWDPPSHIREEMSGGRLKSGRITADYLMTAEGARTRLSYSSEFEGGGLLMRILRPILAVVHRSYCRNMIQRLKKMVEQTARQGDA